MQIIFERDNSNLQKIQPQIDNEQQIVGTLWDESLLASEVI
jgi:hypothetical protein